MRRRKGFSRKARIALDRAQTGLFGDRVDQIASLFDAAGRDRSLRKVRCANQEERECGWHIVIETDMGLLGVVVKASIHRAALEERHCELTTAVVCIPDGLTDRAVVSKMREPVRLAYEALCREHAQGLEEQVNEG